MPFPLAIFLAFCFAFTYPLIFIYIGNKLEKRKKKKDMLKENEKWKEPILDYTGTRKKYRLTFHFDHPEDRETILFFTNKYENIEDVKKHFIQFYESKGKKILRIEEKEEESGVIPNS